MPKAFEEWTVLPHEQIEQLAENLWCVTGSLPGMSLRRNMTIARLGSGELVVHSAIALDEISMRRIETWGTPAFLVVPNGGHRLDAKIYKRRYPALRVVAPRGQRNKVAKVVPVDLTYEEFPVTDRSVELWPLPGVGDSEGAMIVRSNDGVTVVLNDAMFNMDRKRDLLGFLFTTIFGSAPGPRVSRLAKLVYVKDPTALRAEFERFADLPDLIRVVVSHEKIAHGEAARAALRRAATYL
jgi:hypothetical protein